MSELTKPVVSGPKPFVFVLMPFDKRFNDIYEFGVKGAAADAGAYAERVDEQIHTDSIYDRIVNQIAKADIIVADMTGRNPNVYYEVGYAHALGKRVFLLTQDAGDIPFDLKHRPHIVYGGEIQTLRESLVRSIAWAIQNPIDDATLISPCPFDLWINGTKVPEAGRGEPPRLSIVFDPSDGLASVELLLRNTTSKGCSVRQLYLLTPDKHFLVPRWHPTEAQSPLFRHEEDADAAEGLCLRYRIRTEDRYLDAHDFSVNYFSVSWRGAASMWEVSDVTGSQQWCWRPDARTVETSRAVAQQVQFELILDESGSGNVVRRFAVIPVVGDCKIARN